jgi:biopolymer transport protein ExbB/TolQ
MIVDRLLRVALLGSSWVLYLLFALSVVSIAAMLERWLFFRRFRADVDALNHRLTERLASDDFGGALAILLDSPALEARIVARAANWAHGGAAAFSDALDSETQRARKELERGLTFIGTLGNNAPFIGLFGTVLGVIEAFHHLGDAGRNQAAMGSVMGGIAEALIATGVGLFVAIPAVVGYNVAQKKIADIESGAASLGKLIGAFIHTRESQGRAIEAFAPPELQRSSVVTAREESPDDGAVRAIALGEGAE